MAILFRPFLPVDKTHWIPALRAGLGNMDFRIWPDCGDPAEIEYLICWGVKEEDKTGWPNLKAILSLRAGFDRWFVGNPYLPENVPLVRMIDPGLIASMTEYVCAYVLRFHRNLDDLENSRDDSLWSGIVVRLASERSIGIMGMGELGAACAKALVSLGFRVRGWSRHRKSLPNVESFAGQAELDKFLEKSEILVCLLPLTSETENILCAETFGKLPRGAYLINAARGAHVADQDLMDALDSGQLAGAALDVFRKEPLPQDHPFRAHPKITITPHISAITNPVTGTAVLRRTIEAIGAGKKPPGLYDPAREY